MSTHNDDRFNLLQDAIKATKSAGADAVEAIMADQSSLGVSVRLGKKEDIERSGKSVIGIRVFVGQKSATSALEILTRDAIRDTAESVVAAARLSSDNPYGAMAETAQLGMAEADLDLWDDTAVNLDRLFDLAERAEQSALTTDKRVKNSEGASASWGKSEILILATNGFQQHGRRTSHGFNVNMIAEDKGQKERGGDYSTALHAADLESPEMIGRRAAEKAAAALNPRKIRAGAFPVVFDPDMGRGLIGHFLGAINGMSVHHGTTFLKDLMNQQVFGPDITIIDNPLLKRGFASQPFDGEGLPTAPMTLVENGILRAWLLDLESARVLGLKPTANAGNGVGSSPHPTATNVAISGGKMSRNDLIGGIKDGLYVTGLMGQGVRLLTGDYSRAAKGFWIKNGKLSHPVANATIAGNLRDMFRAMTAADDLNFKRASITVPTLRVDGMTIA